MKQEFEIVPKKGTRKKISVFSSLRKYVIIEEVSLGRENKWLVYLSSQRPRHYLGATSVDDIVDVGPAVATIKGGHKRARRWGSKGGSQPAKNRPFHINMNYNEQVRRGWAEPTTPVSSLEEAISSIVEAMELMK